MNISSRYQSAIDSIESSTWRMKHADACCARPGTPMLNHTGELKDAFCVTRMCLSSALNVSRSSSVAKRPCSTPHVGDRVDDAVDDLLDRPLTRRRVELPAEVLLGDDVRRVQRPVGRELDVVLLEADLARVGHDLRVAALPLDLVVGVHPGRGEQAGDRETDRVSRRSAVPVPVAIRHAARLGTRRCDLARWPSYSSSPPVGLLTLPLPADTSCLL